MDEHQNLNDNPLEDAAAEMSEGLRGTTVQVEQTSKSRVEGGQVRMVDSAAKSVSASALHMEESAAAIVRSGSVDASESAMGVTLASDVSLLESNALLAVAKTVQASDSRALMVIAARVDGKVETLFTPLTALAAGAGFSFGLVVFARSLNWLMARFVRRRRGKNGQGAEDN